MGTDTPRSATSDDARFIAKPTDLQVTSANLIEQYQHHFASSLKSALPTFTKPIAALDLVCGTGLSTMTIAPELPAGSRIVAIGDDRVELKVFHDRLSKEDRRFIFPRKDRLHRLPFAPEVFDLIWMGLLNQQPNPLRPVLRQALRSLRIQGHLILAVPLHETFLEITSVMSPRLRGFSNSQAFTTLMAEPHHLLTAEDWRENLHRCGGIDIDLKRDTFTATLPAPLSRQPLFARYLLSLWLGDDPVIQARCYHLLDDAITEPINITLHTARIHCRRGPNELIEDITQ
ncbi:MAG: hypothetical protein A2289_03250 [Deltaproteobacteria bacterium RIFOXYA12_FULL_58_15]|nr:MAG: hypothetical protein A2289_03250 [Deltaproteobacteria bacterium RIFOXYA12_FULL_58_15]OGR07111.1 MAG: hypothetical protein A2341_24570 [Deltaproteobacteria bacterium RIFOXYB12_FULL_58_9]